MMLDKLLSNLQRIYKFGQDWYSKVRIHKWVLFIYGCRDKCEYKYLRNKSHWSLTFVRFIGNRPVTYVTHNRYVILWWGVNLIYRMTMCDVMYSCSFINTIHFSRSVVFDVYKGKYISRFFTINHKSLSFDSSPTHLGVVLPTFF